VDEARRIRRPLGTDAYMAPEQCDPALAPIGPPADVWGLGATLYEAIGGKVPFPRSRRREPREALERHPQLSGSPPPPLGDAPAPLVEAVMACLSFDPGARPSAGAVADALAPLLEEIRPRNVLGRRRPRLR
jgi:serine/threonine protein kinase